MNVNRNVFKFGVGCLAYYVFWPSQPIFYRVNSGEKAIIFNKYDLPGMKEGVQDYVLGTGLHFIIPFIQYPILYELGTKHIEYSTYVGTKDQHKVNLNLRILYRPVEENILKTHLIHDDKHFAERLLPSIAPQVLWSVIAHYDGDQILENREKIANDIKEIMNTRVKESIIIEDVSFEDLKISVK